MERCEELNNKLKLKLKKLYVRDHQSKLAGDKRIAWERRERLQLEWDVLTAKSPSM